jgi:hypothetical protein
MSTNIDNVTYTYSGSTASVTGFTGGAIGVVIPSSITVSPSTYTVTSIGDNAFLGKLLTSVSIPASVINIGGGGFYNCENLASVTFESGSTLASIGGGGFYNCHSLTSVTIPNSVTSIERDAFTSCRSLASVIFESGSNLASIQPNVFRETGLTSVKIPNSVTNIGEAAFYGCNYLKSVTFEAGSKLQSIDINVFRNTPLTTITIPASVQSIGARAFQDTPSEIVVTFGSTAIPTLTIPFAYAPNTTKQGTAIYQPRTSQSGITTLESYFTTVQEAAAPICFLEGTKILTKEGYKKIEELKKGDLVKTLLNGYKKIDMIGYKNMWNQASEERIKDQLYVYKKKNVEEVFEDLVLTGCHSVLIDRFETSEKREKVRSLLGGIFITEKKARLPACLDERAEVYKSEGFYTIYHVALENELYTNSYGIYANGLLVESCSIKHLREISQMIFIE